MTNKEGRHEPLIDDSYPELYFPFKELKTADLLNVNLSKPVAPVKPENSKGQVKYFEPLGLLFLLPAFLGIGFIASLYFTPGTGTAFIVIFWAVILAYPIYKLFEISIENTFLLKQRRADKQNEKELYARQTQYYADLTKYASEKEEYDKEISRRRELSKSLSKVAYISSILGGPQVAIPSIDAIKVGPGEKFFLPYLNELESTGFQVLINQCVPAGNSKFYPDFVLISRNSGMCYDIEIDEPYTIDTKQPIHCNETSIRPGSDCNRNNYLVSKGWTVIRFSEHQVFASPHYCIDYIATVDDYFLSGAYDYILNYEYHNESFMEKKWGLIEAKNMIKFNYREKYINTVMNDINDSLPYNFFSDKSSSTLPEDVLPF